MNPKRSIACFLWTIITRPLENVSKNFRFQLLQLLAKYGIIYKKSSIS